ncbi:MAG: polysaccharide biosynthesis protein, partial [Chitinophagaceae bacterium]
MIAILRGLQRKHFGFKFIEWTRVLSITGGAQVIVQFIGVISGIMIIRFLPTQEYALYTLGNSMLGVLTMLADSGISTGVMAQGGKVWQDKNKLGAVLVTGSALRKKFGIVSFLISAPILLYLLLYNGASWLTSILILGSILVAFVAALSTSLLEVAPKLKQDILPLQKNQLQANIGRLALIGATVFFFPWAFIAILGNGLPRIWANFRLRKISDTYADWHQQTDPFVRKEILTIVKRILPGTIWVCVSGQVTLWMISLFGTVTAIASLGALSRLTMVLTLLNVLSATLFIPRFARLAFDKTLLLKRVIQAFGVFALISVCILLFVKLFTNELLWVLGGNYNMLKKELFLSVSVSCVGMIAGLAYQFASCRGWIMKPWLSIPLSFLFILGGIFLFDISTLTGILYFNLFIMVGEVVKNITYLLLRIIK